jgi:hypothetical protein
MVIVWSQTTAITTKLTLDNHQCFNLSECYWWMLIDVSGVGSDSGNLYRESNLGVALDIGVVSIGTIGTPRIQCLQYDEECM